jgi:hypothetical protein
MSMACRSARSRMSSDKPPEFFFDRSLGRRSAQLLVDVGWIIHMIADHYPDDAAHVPDVAWIEEGCSKGWVLLTKDQRIRYRSHELGALQGQLFCLSSGNLAIIEMAHRFLATRPAIDRAVARDDVGFWLVYAGGRVEKKWP